MGEEKEEKENEIFLYEAHLKRKKVWNERKKSEKKRINCVWSAIIQFEQQSVFKTFTKKSEKEFFRKEKIQKKEKANKQFI